MSKYRAGDIPGPITHQVSTPAIAADGATLNVIAFRAPFACVVKRCGFTSSVAFTGDNTNFKNFNLIYKGADGSTGAVEVGNLDGVTGVNLVAFDEKDIPLNATYLANGVTMAEGDILSFQFEESGGGGTTGAIGSGLLTLDIYPS